MRLGMVNEQGILENIIEADTGFKLEGYSLVTVDENQLAIIGAIWDGSKFTPPNTKTEQNLSPTEKKLADLQNSVDTLTMQMLMMGGSA